MLPCLSKTEEKRVWHLTGEDQGDSREADLDVTLSGGDTRIGTRRDRFRNWLRALGDKADLLVSRQVQVTNQLSPRRLMVHPGRFAGLGRFPKPLVIGRLPRHGSGSLPASGVSLLSLLCNEAVRETPGKPSRTGDSTILEFPDETIYASVRRCAGRCAGRLSPGRLR